MSEKKEVSRRSFVKYAGAGAVAVAAVAAGAYYLTQPPAQPPTTTTTKPPTTTAPPPSPVTLELWTSFAGEKTQEDYFNEFAGIVAQKYPHITLKTTHYLGADFIPKLTTAMGAGAPPDLFVSYGGGQLKALVDAGQVEDQSTFLNEAWAKVIIPDAAKSPHTFKGSTYALPYELNTCWLLTNKTLFSQAGVELPTTPWTWDEFMNVIKKFKAAGIYPLTIPGLTPRHMVYHLDYLIERIAGQERFLKTLNRESGYSFTDAPFVDAFQKYKDLVDVGAFHPNCKGYKYLDAVKSFGTGEAAMLAIYTWVVTIVLHDFPGFNLDLIPYPTVPGGAGGPDVAAYTLGMAMAKGSKYKSDAYNVLQAFATKDAMTEYAKTTGNPICLNVVLPADTLNPVSQKALDLAKQSSKFVFRKEQFMPPELGSKYLEVGSKIFYGDMTPQDAVAALESTAQELKNLGKLPM